MSEAQGRLLDLERWPWCCNRKPLGPLYLEGQYIPMRAYYCSSSRNTIVFLSIGIRLPSAQQNLQILLAQITSWVVRWANPIGWRCCKIWTQINNKDTHHWQPTVSTSKPQRWRPPDEEGIVDQRRLALLWRNRWVKTAATRYKTTSMPADDRIYLCLDFGLLLRETCGCHQHRTYCHSSLRPGFSEMFWEQLNTPPYRIQLQRRRQQGKPSHPLSGHRDSCFLAHIS